MLQFVSWLPSTGTAVIARPGIQIGRSGHVWRDFAFSSGTGLETAAAGASVVAWSELFLTTIQARW